VRRVLPWSSWLLVAVLGLGAAAGQAERVWFSQPFSARVLQPHPADPQRKVTGRLYAGTAGLRFEEPSPPGRVYIYDRQGDRTWVLFPAQKRYRELKGPGPLAQFLPNPGGNPCAGTPAKNVTCRKARSERVNGRLADLWEVEFKVGDRKLVSRQWVDRQLGAWVRWVTYEGRTVDVVDLRVGPQPADLFRVPKGYTLAR
jgi:hypothetical protein